jgi:hypothetical protein
MEFLDSVRSKMNYPCLIAEAYENGFADNRSDNIYKIYSGAFIILDQTGERNDYDQIEVTLDRCEEIGMDALSYLKKYFKERLSDRYYEFNNTTIRPIVLPEQNLAGVRVDISFKKTANPDLKYVPGKWINPL